MEQLITTVLDDIPSRRFDKFLPLDLSSYWFTRVAGLSKGDEIAAIRCREPHCDADQCGHNPWVAPDDIYVIQQVTKGIKGTRTVCRIHTDRGYWDTNPGAFAVILTHDGEKVRSVLEDVTV